MALRSAQNILPSPAPPGGSGYSCHLGLRQECGLAQGHLIQSNKQQPSKSFFAFRYGAGHIRADRPAKDGLRAAFNVGGFTKLAVKRENQRTQIGLSGDCVLGDDLHSAAVAAILFLILANSFLGANYCSSNEEHAALTEDMPLCPQTGGAMLI